MVRVALTWSHKARSLPNSLYKEQPNHVMIRPTCPSNDLQTVQSDAGSNFTTGMPLHGYTSEIGSDYKQDYSYDDFSP